jgi:hypothetical protein
MMAPRLGSSFLLVALASTAPRETQGQDLLSCDMIDPACFSCSDVNPTSAESGCALDASMQQDLGVTYIDPALSRPDPGGCPESCLTELGPTGPECGIPGRGQAAAETLFDLNNPNDSVYTCTMCGPGKYRLNSDVTSGDYIEGSWTSAYCAACPAGKYQDKYNVWGEDSCKDCEAGTYGAEGECWLTTIYPIPGMTKEDCANDPDGFFGYNWKDTPVMSCTACPAGKTSPVASESEDACADQAIVLDKGSGAVERAVASIGLLAGTMALARALA